MAIDLDDPIALMLAASTAFERAGIRRMAIFEALHIGRCELDDMVGARGIDHGVGAIDDLG